MGSIRSVPQGHTVEPLLWLYSPHCASKLLWSAIVPPGYRVIDSRLCLSPASIHRHFILPSSFLLDIISSVVFSHTSLGLKWCSIHIQPLFSYSMWVGEGWQIAALEIKITCVRICRRMALSLPGAWKKCVIFHPDLGRGQPRTMNFTGDGDSVWLLSASLLV